MSQSMTFTCPTWCLKEKSNDPISNWAGFIVRLEETVMLAEAAVEGDSDSHRSWHCPVSFRQGCACRNAGKVSPCASCAPQARNRYRRRLPSLIPHMHYDRSRVSSVEEVSDWEFLERDDRRGLLKLLCPEISVYQYEIKALALNLARPAGDGDEASRSRPVVAASRS